MMCCKYVLGEARLKVTAGGKEFRDHRALDFDPGTGAAGNRVVDLRRGRHRPPKVNRRWHGRTPKRTPTVLQSAGNCWCMLTFVGLISSFIGPRCFLLR